MHAATDVLIVEDNPGDARLVEFLLQDAPEGSFTVRCASRLSEALPHLAAGWPDVVLLDLGLPDSHGLETVVRAHQAAPGAPLVVLTGYDDEALAMQALEAGAQDYLVKGQVGSDVVARTIRHAVQRQRLQAEADLARQRQLQLKTEFLSHVSHELRSPLTAVYLLVSAVRDGAAGELNAEQHEYLDVAVRNVTQLTAMIDDLLEVTRAETGHFRVEPRATDVAAAIAHAVRTVGARAAEAGLVLTAAEAEALPTVYADPSRVQQVLVNLLENAVKFTPRGGRIAVSARPCEGDAVCIAVTDTGCGIPPEHRERVFDRLHQVDRGSSAGRQGLGLGLHICKQIVDRHSGRLWVESEVGQGSTFSFTLPVFSLHTLLQPLLAQQEAPPAALALVTVELTRPALGMSDEGWRDAMRDARAVLQRCTLPDRDVLLPPLLRTASAETLLVVAVADETGAQVLEGRIRQQLSRHETLGAGGAAWSVQSTVTGVAAEAAADPAALPDAVPGVAALVATLESVLSATSTPSGAH